MDSRSQWFKLPACQMPRFDSLCAPWREVDVHVRLGVVQVNVNYAQVYQPLLFDSTSLNLVNLLQHTHTPPHIFLLPRPISTHSSKTAHAASSISLCFSQPQAHAMATNQLLPITERRESPPSLPGSFNSDDSITPGHINFWKDPNYSARPTPASTVHPASGSQNTQAQHRGSGSVARDNSPPQQQQQGKGPVMAENHSKLTASAAIFHPSQAEPDAAFYPHPNHYTPLNEEVAHSVNKSLLEASRNDPHFGALLNRVARGVGTQQDHAKFGEVNQTLVKHHNSKWEEDAARRATDEANRIHVQGIMRHIFAAATGAMTPDELNKIEDVRGTPAHKATDAEVNFINAILDKYVHTGLYHGLKLVELVHVAVRTTACWGTSWGNPDDPSLSEPVIVDLLQWGKDQGIEQDGFRAIVKAAAEKHYSTPWEFRGPNMPTQTTGFQTAGETVLTQPNSGFNALGHAQTTRQLPKKFAPKSASEKLGDRSSLVSKTTMRSDRQLGRPTAMPGLGAVEPNLPVVLAAPGDPQKPRELPKKFQPKGAGEEHSEKRVEARVPAMSEPVEAQPGKLNLPSRYVSKFFPKEAKQLDG
ncbi:hypothetical protein BU16DRAFT_542535 [Lophium mytilinum]|uniref:Uncharacterized protein n=1 Tax=Lophium mytilinum TaxID=390894 RepID=A0A6A6QHD5_9PEZI|nr:hypothetical protein BU16DRAFT_542535 [Lophium mytilinum]